MKTIAIIPARYASTRLPAKPLADIGGKPMIQHVAERAGRASRIAEVIVATDDARIVEAVERFGGTAVMTPEDLQSGTDRVAFVARQRPDAGIVVNVQGDEPLIEPDMIDQAVEPLQRDPSLQAGTLVREIDTDDDLVSPGVVKTVLDKSGFCLYFSRSSIPHVRDFPRDTWRKHHRFYKHIGLYVFRRDILLRYADLPQTPLEEAENLEQLRLLENGYRIFASITTYDSAPVDTAADLDRVRTLLGRRYE
jgi:3-deoxy-manno-octulosonate cytidylyltransferase (CMP-KDO synthetase)